MQFESRLSASPIVRSLVVKEAHKPFRDLLVGEEVGFCGTYGVNDLINQAILVIPLNDVEFTSLKAETDYLMDHGIFNYYGITQVLILDSFQDRINAGRHLQEFIE